MRTWHADTGLNIVKRRWKHHGKDRLSFQVRRMPRSVRRFLGGVTVAALLVLGLGGAEYGLAPAIGLGVLLGAFSPFFIAQFVRAHRLCGVVKLDREQRELRVEEGCRNLLAVTSARFEADDVLLVRPYQQKWRSGRHLQTAAAYRLIRLSSTKMPSAELGLVASWAALREQVASAVSDELAPPVLDGGTRLATFDSLALTVEFAQHLGEGLGVPVVDLTLAPEALVDTVEAQPRPLDGAGRLAIVELTAEAGQVSLPAMSEGALSAPGGVVTPASLPEKRRGGRAASAAAGRVRQRPFTALRETGEDCEQLRIRPPWLSVLIRAVVGALGLWLLMGPWTWLAVDEGGFSAWISVCAGALVGGSLGLRRVRLLRLDAAHLELVDGPGVNPPGRLAWQDIRAVEIVDDKTLTWLDGSRLEIRSTSGRHILSVSRASAEWLREELLRWIQGAAWTEGRESEKGTSE